MVGATDPTFRCTIRFMKVSFNPQDLDLEKVISWLSKDSYWAFGRDPELIKKSFNNSVPLSAIDDSGNFVGVGRLVTDNCTFGWLCDVFVDPSFRGRGIGHAIAKSAIEYFKDVPKFRLILKTRDAHSVYKDVGFDYLENPQAWMAIERGF